MTLEIIPWILVWGMQICLPPHLAGLFKPAPAGLASHEVIGKKDEKIPTPPPSSTLLHGKGTFTILRDSKQHQPKERLPYCEDALLCPKSSGSLVSR